MKTWKQRTVIIGIIAIIALAACQRKSDQAAKDGEQNKSWLTITGLDAYNGKYLYAMGIDSDDDGNFWVRSSPFAGINAEISTYAEINGGSATTKVWDSHNFDDTGMYNGYNGNSTVKFFIFILNDAEGSSGDRDIEEGAIAQGTMTVTFKNGVANGVFFEEDDDAPIGSNESAAISDDGGTFTLTGIPAKLNGNYAVFKCDNLPYILGMHRNFGQLESGGPTVYYSEAIQITNGIVSLPMWDERGDNVRVRYTGNDTDSCKVIICDVANPGANGDFIDFAIVVLEFASITFVNGSASKGWSEAM